MSTTTTKGYKLSISAIKYLTDLEELYAYPVPFLLPRFDMIFQLNPSSTRAEMNLTNSTHCLLRQRFLVIKFQKTLHEKRIASLSWIRCIGGK